MDRCCVVQLDAVDSPLPAPVGNPPGKDDENGAGKNGNAPAPHSGNPMEAKAVNDAAAYTRSG